MTRTQNSLGDNVSIVLSVLDDASHLPILLRQLPVDAEVVLVDRGSMDDTIAVARESRPGIRVFKRSGATRGRALVTGLAAATRDIIATMPVDGSADPAELGRFVEAVEQGADFAKGSRFVEGGGVSEMTSFEVVGSRVLSWLGRRTVRVELSDPGYGFYALRARLRDGLDLRGADQRQIDTVVALRLVAAGASVVEVPSVQRFRIFGESTRRWSEDFRDVRVVMAERRRLRTAPGDELLVC